MIINNSKVLAATLLILSIAANSALATYDGPWLPDWSSEAGYTSQFWGLNALEGAEPTQPLSADIYNNNSYGTATATWVNDETNGYVSWAETMMGSHPSWATGVYGGMTNFADFDVSASIDTGSETGSLLVFVQYDWYAYTGADVSAVIDGATDITPGSYYDYQIDKSGSGNPWYRTTQVFEITNTSSLDISFTGSGFATGIDSFSITTVVGDASALVPASMPIPEPATIAILGIGGMLAGLRKKG